MLHKRSQITLSLVLACGGVLGSASPSRGFFNESKQAKITILWIPAEDFSKWSELDDILEHYRDLRFTVAVAPEDVPPEAAAKLASWNAAGRLELALRLKGDPVLPLIVSHPAAPRPQDALERLAAASQAFRKAFGAPPSGFAPGQGAVSPSLFPALGAAGISWVASGDYASSQTWAAQGQTAFVPLKTAGSPEAELRPEDLSLPEYPRADAFVVDEADGLVPQGTWLRLLRRFSDKHPKPGWGTVSEALAAGREKGLSPAVKVSAWPAWGSIAPASAAARRAWKAYGEAALALSRYQNSGSADVKDLELAADELYAAQAGAYYRWLGQPQLPEASAADRELRAHLTAVYRKTRQTPPEALFASLLSGAPRDGDAESEAAPGSTDVHFSRGEGWLSFENPAGSSARAPESFSPLADGTPASELWRVRSLRVEWGPSGTVFVFRLGKLQDESLGPLVLDAYIDLNRTPGAGSVHLLPGRAGALAARDAWEYALTVSGREAYFYRSNPLGSPLQQGRLAMSADPASGEVRVTVPSSLLRGTPLRWGYAVLAMAVDPMSPPSPPFRPASDPKRGAILGLLAPLEQQSAVRAEPLRPRLAALRAPDR